MPAVANDYGFEPVSMADSYGFEPEVKNDYGFEPIEQPKPVVQAVIPQPEPAPEVPPTAVQPTAPKPEGAVMSALRPLLTGTIPAAATAVGGIASGAIAGGLSSELGPGAIPIAMVADVYGGSKVGKAALDLQSWIMGDKWVKENAAQIAANAVAHPMATGLGKMVPQVLSMAGGARVIREASPAIRAAAEAERAGRAIEPLSYLQKVAGALPASATSGARAATSEAVQENKPIGEALQAGVKGGVLMGPLAFVPAAKTIIGDMLLKGPTDAGVLALSSGLYDWIIGGKQPDAISVFKDGIESVPGFVLLNLVTGLIHGKPFSGEKSTQQTETPNANDTQQQQSSAETELSRISPRADVPTNDEQIRESQGGIPNGGGGPVPRPVETEPAATETEVNAAKQAVEDALQAGSIHLDQANRLREELKTPTTQSRTQTISEGLGQITQDFIAARERINQNAANLRGSSETGLPHKQTEPGSTPGPATIPPNARDANASRVLKEVIAAEQPKAQEKVAALPEPVAASTELATAKPSALKPEAPKGETAANPFDTSETSKRLTELQKSKPRPLNKLYGPNPTTEQTESSKLATRNWNRDYRAAQKAHKETVEKSNEWIRSQAEPTPKPTERQSVDKPTVRESKGELLDPHGLWEGVFAKKQPSQMTSDELREFISALSVTGHGSYLLDHIYESNVGERAPQNSGDLVDFLMDHYEQYPQDLKTDFRQVPVRENPSWGQSRGGVARNPISEQEATKAVNERLGTSDIPGNITFFSDASPEAPKGRVTFTKGELPKIEINLAKHDTPDSVKDTLVHELLHPVQEDSAMADAVRAVADLVQESDLARKAALGYSADETPIEATNELIRKFFQEHANSNIFQRAVTQVVIAAKRLFGIDLTARQAAVFLVQDAVKNHVAMASGEGLSRDKNFEQQRRDEEAIAKEMGLKTTRVMGSNVIVNDREIATPANDAESIKFAQDLIRAQGDLSNVVENDPKLGGVRFVSDGWEHDAEGRMLIDALRKELLKESNNENPYKLSSLLNSIAINWKKGNLDGVFSQPVRDELFQLAQSRRSFLGLMLHSLQRFGDSLRQIASDANVVLTRIRSDQFGGEQVRVFINRVLNNFHNLFTEEEIRKAMESNPEGVATVNRIIDAQIQNSGGRVYRAVQARMVRRPARTESNKERMAKDDEAIAAIIEQAKRDVPNEAKYGDLAGAKGLVEAVQPEGQTLDPDKRLGLMSRPETQEKIQHAAEVAIATGERNAAITAMRKFLASTVDPEAKKALGDEIALVEDGTANPDAHWVEEGLKLPEFNHWKRVRDDLLDYSPTTLKLVQDVISGRIKGTKFKPTPEKAADLRIDLGKLAVSKDSEVKRVFDAQMAEIEKIMDLNRATPETRVRVKQAMEGEIADQLTAKRQAFVDNLFDPKQWIKFTPSERLQRLLNAKLAEDRRFKDAKVREIIKKVANENLNADELASLATSIRQEKFNWLRTKTDEIMRPFNGEPEATREFLEAVTLTHLAERLQAAEEVETRRFLGTNETDFSKRPPTTPEQQAQRTEEAKSRLEGIIRAGGIDNTMIESAARKSAFQKFVPTMADLVKKVFSTPFYRQSELKQRFADAMTRDLGIDPANVDKAWEVFQSAYSQKIDEATRRAAKMAKDELTPKERREILGNERSKRMRTIERNVNAGNLDTSDILRQLAIDNGHVQPTDREVAKMKSLSEEIQRLENLTPEEEQAIRDNPEIPEDQKDDEISRQSKEKADTMKYQVAPMQRELAARWSKMTQNTNLAHWWSNRKNIARGLNEYETLNILTKPGFLFRLPVHLATQFVLHTPTAAIGRAWENFLTTKGTSAHASFTKEVGSALMDSLKSTILAMKPAIAAASVEIKGRGQISNLDRMMSGVNMMERVHMKMQALAANGDYTRAAAVWMLNFPRVIGHFISAVDAFQGVPVEYQNIIHQIDMTMAGDGRTMLERKIFKDTIYKMMQGEIVTAVADTRAMFDANGRTATESDIKAGAYQMVRRRIYDALKSSKLAADDFEGNAKILQDTLAWKVKTERGPGYALMTPFRYASQILESIGLPFSGGRLTNAAATGINWTFLNTPFYKLVNVGPGPESTWFATPLDCRQRQVQAIVGSVGGLALAALIQSGVATANLWGPRDKKEREMWKAGGHVPLSLEINNKDGSFTPISLIVGPGTIFAPFAFASQTFKDSADSRVKKQQALDAEAERTGMEAGKVEPLTAAEQLTIAGFALGGALMGTRGAAGILSSGMVDGVPDVKKSIGSQVQALAVGLPAYSEISRMMGVQMDRDLASVLDYIVPLPSSQGREYNILGDPVKTPDDLQRVIQVVTGGTWPFPVDPKQLLKTQAYANYLASGYHPPATPLDQAHAIDGVLRPLTRAESIEYTRIKTTLFREELSSMNIDGLEPKEAKKEVAAAYKRANEEALTRVGVDVEATKAQPAVSERAMSGDVSISSGSSASWTGLGRAPTAEREASPKPEPTRRTQNAPSGSSTSERASLAPREASTGASSGGGSGSSRSSIRSRSSGKLRKTDRREGIRHAHSTIPASRQSSAKGSIRLPKTRTTIRGARSHRIVA